MKYYNTKTEQIPPHSHYTMSKVVSQLIVVMLKLKHLSTFLCEMNNHNNILPQKNMFNMHIKVLLIFILRLNTYFKYMHFTTENLPYLKIFPLNIDRNIML
ncbi:unnamed protein product [Meganyctiphanes norvegica]|uniref:Uncharacterized protein n=1 Tax=Meganyctiphanes norvegica TaxID=48144 RepID=A0AAV2PFB9_MEGNR